jgi:hypothetical protein
VPNAKAEIELVRSANDTDVIVRLVHCGPARSRGGSDIEPSGTESHSSRHSSATGITVHLYADVAI